MTPNGYRLFLYLASYTHWDSDPKYALQLFSCLERFGFCPHRLDERDPPKRLFKGGETDAKFWFAKKRGMGRRLFAERTGQLPVFSLTAHWVDRGIELARVRGDYHSLQMSITVDERSADTALSLWRDLCEGLDPHHAFLDMEDAYNLRAHHVTSDGHVTKSTGWYLQRLPGFFAHNYFGRVYLRRWGPAVATLPTSYIAPNGQGLFIDAPSRLDLTGQRNAVYSPDDIAIIQAIGPEWFRLPGRVDHSIAPSAEEFLSATQDFNGGAS